jgi:hypothetical protein
MRKFYRPGRTRLALSLAAIAVSGGLATVTAATAGLTGLVPVPGLAVIIGVPAFISAGYIVGRGMRDGLVYISPAALTRAASGQRHGAKREPVIVTGIRLTPRPGEWP